MMCVCLPSFTVLVFYSGLSEYEIEYNSVKKKKHFFSSSFNLKLTVECLPRNELTYGGAIHK